MCLGKTHSHSVSISIIYTTRQLCASFLPALIFGMLGKPEFSFFLHSRQYFPSVFLCLKQSRLSEESWKKPQARQGEEKLTLLTRSRTIDVSLEISHRRRSCFRVEQRTSASSKQPTQFPLTKTFTRSLMTSGVISSKRSKPHSYKDQDTVRNKTHLNI